MFSCSLALNLARVWNLQLFTVTKRIPVEITCLNLTVNTGNYTHTHVHEHTYTHSLHTRRNTSARIHGHMHADTRHLQSVITVSENSDGRNMIHELQYRRHRMTLGSDVFSSSCVCVCVPVLSIPVLIIVLFVCSQALILRTTRSQL